jgi:hypothetical protein
LYSVEKITFALASLEHLFPKPTGFTFGLGGALTQVCILITNLMEKHMNNQERLLVLVKDIVNTSSIDFSLELRRWLKISKNEEEKIFNNFQEKEIDTSIIERVLSDMGAETLFEVENDNAYTLLGIWHELDNVQINNYVNSIVKTHPEKCLILLTSITSTIISSNYPDPYKGDFRKDEYDFVCKITDIKVLRNSILKLYGEDIIKEEAQFFNREPKQTTINILRQFEHWYLEDHKDTV